MELYDNIRKRRIELGMSQESLARKAGYSGKSAIAHIEKGERELPLSKLIAIAEALYTTPGELMGDTEEDRRRDYLFTKYGALMSDLDGMSEEDQKQVEQFIKFKMLQQSDE